MTTEIKLIYGHDPICGWCYAFIPTLRKFSESYPDTRIELVAGGLISGDRIQPYATMYDYVTNAFARVQQSTGRIGSDAFFSMVQAPETGLVVSAPPTHALMQVEALAPERVVEFAHALQEAHFEQGLSYNYPNTYDSVTDALGLSKLDTDSILAATDDTPLVRQSYARAAALNIRSFPTCLVVDENDHLLGVIDGIYNPEQFIAAFEQIQNRVPVA